jgi:hypothetical protein
VRWLLWLFPRAWRRRYGDEYLALIEQLGASPRVLADTVAGAIGAHADRLRAQTPVVSPAGLEVAPAAAEPATPPPALARAHPDHWESALDQIVREARERGAFDNLAGAGRPLPSDENPFAGEWEMAFRFVRLAGETLPWIALGREIEAEQGRLQADLDGMAARLAWLRERDPAVYQVDRDEARARYLARAAALDAKLAEHARLVPHPRFERRRLPAATAAWRFDEVCPG